MTETTTPSDWKIALSTKLHEGWDCCLCCDGSGSQWSFPGGWSAMIFLPPDRKIHVHGGANHSTNIQAEILSWLLALDYLAALPEFRHQAQRYLEQQKLLRCLVLTDCEWVAQTGNELAQGRAPRSDLAHYLFWSGLWGLRRNGWYVEFFLVPRNVLPAQKETHDQANLCRVLFKSQSP